MNFLLLAFLYIWCPAKVKNNPRKKVIELRSRNPCAKENSATNQNSKPKPKMIRAVIEFFDLVAYVELRIIGRNLRSVKARRPPKQSPIIRELVYAPLAIDHWRCPADMLI